MIAEVALAIVGLMGAGLFIRSMQNASDIDPGWATQGLFTMSISPASAGYSHPDAIRFVERALSEVRNVPGVEQASFATSFRGQIPTGSSSLSWGCPIVATPTSWTCLPSSRRLPVPMSRRNTRSMP